MQRLGYAIGVDTVTLPTHQAGDAIILFAFRDGSTTNPTVPAGNNWSSTQHAGSTICRTLAYKIATSSSEGVGTFTGATGCIAVIYRPDAGRALTFGNVGINSNGSSLTVNYDALTLAATNSRSWIVAFCGHASADVNIGLAPSGLTNIGSYSDATNRVGAHDSNGPRTTNWTSTNATHTGTSGAYVTASLEIRESSTAVTLSPGSESIQSGETADLTANVLSDGSPSVGVAVTTASSDTSKVAAFAVSGSQSVAASAYSAATNVTYSTPGGTSPSGATIRRFTETTAFGGHMWEGWNVLSGAASGDARYLRVEYRGTRNGVRIDQSGNSYCAGSINLSTGVTGDVDGAGTVIVSRPIGDGWYEVTVFNPSAANTTSGDVYILPSIESGGSFNDSYTGSTSEWFELGAITVARGASTGGTTDSSGNCTIRTLGVANGRSSVTATSNSVTSSASSVAVESPVVSLLPSSPTVEPGDFTDLTVTVTQGSGAVSGAFVAASSSDTTKARAYAGLATLPTRDGLWGVTVSAPGGTAPSGASIIRLTETTESAPHEGEWTFATSFPADSTVLGVAEVKDTAGRGFIHVGFSDNSVVAGTILTVSSGALTNYEGIGSVVSGARDLGGGWWQVWVAWTKATTAVPFVVVGTSQSTTYGQFSGSTSYYIDVGRVWMLEPATTNSSGQTTARIVGIAYGTANITATARGITSSAVPVTGSLRSALDETESSRTDYIKATEQWQVAEFSLDPIAQPASGTPIVIEYDASNAGGSTIKVEIIDPRVY